MIDWQSVLVVVVLVALLAAFLWRLLHGSLINVPAGYRGLLMIRGRASEVSLPPGINFRPSLRRHTVTMYPSVELAYRAGGGPDHDTDLDRHGPRVRVFLGDRAVADVAYTVRFRLDAERLRYVHEQYGASGVFGAVRDLSRLTVTQFLGAGDITTDSLFGTTRNELEASLHTAVEADLGEVGIEVTSFLLADPDLGAAGALVQSAATARLALERERLEAEVRLVRAQNDAHLAETVGWSGEAGYRYRQADLYRDLADQAGGVRLILSDGYDGAVAAAVEPATGDDAVDGAGDGA